MIVYGGQLRFENFKKFKSERDRKITNINPPPLQKNLAVIYKHNIRQNIDFRDNIILPDTQNCKNINVRSRELRRYELFLFRRENGY